MFVPDSGPTTNREAQARPSISGVCRVEFRSRTNDLLPDDFGRVFFEV